MHGVVALAPDESLVLELLSVDESDNSAPVFELSVGASMENGNPLAFGGNNNQPTATQHFSKKKKLTSISKCNILVAEGKQLANIASTDKDEQRHMLLASMHNLHVNYQN